MKKLHLGTILLTGIAAVIAVSGCASSTSTVGTVTPPVGFTKVYGTGYTSGSDIGELLGFTFTGTTATSTLNVTAPTVTDSRSYFNGIAADNSGNVYSILRVFDNDTQQSTCSVAKYSASATGTATPLASFTSSTICTINAAYLGIDSAGNFYVVGYGGTAKFAANSMGMTGDVQPSFTIHGAYANEQGVAYLDPAGNLYATPQGNNGDTIAFYAAGFTASSTPVTFSPSTPSFINAMGTDSTGKIYLVDQNVSTGAISIDVYAAGATSGTPTRSISGLSTGLGYPSAVAVDATGTIYVVDGSTATLPFAVGVNRHASPQPAIPSNDYLVVREYAASASGNVAATGTITTNLPYEYGSNFVLQ